MLGCAGWIWCLLLVFVCACQVVYAEEDTPLVVCSHCDACQTVPHKKFVLYSCNFGSLWKELDGIEKWIAALTNFGIDACLFTDDPNFNPQLDGWTVVYESARETENGIPGTRLSGNHIKFKGHPLLDPHDYYIHVDAAHLRVHKLCECIAGGCCTCT